jgi:hypothetical protein
MSASRYTVNDFTAQYSKRGSKVPVMIWILDILARPLLFVFNRTLRLVVRGLQQQRQQCPQGAGQWIFFGMSDKIMSSWSASTAVFAFVILDASWAAALVHLATEILRFCYLRRKPMSDWNSVLIQESGLSLAYTTCKGRDSRTEIGMLYANIFF